MESWASSGREGVDLSRSSGQLADNVTEERMLISRLRELAKERAKFMSQTDYEKKMFLDRQMRKSEVFKDLIDQIAPGGRMSKLGMRSMSGGNNARMRMLDRLDPTAPKSKEKPTRRDSILGGNADNVDKRNNVADNSTSYPPVVSGKEKTFSTEASLNKNNRLASDVIDEDNDVLPQLEVTNTAAVRFGKYPPVLRKNSSMTISGARGILKEKRLSGSLKVKPTGGRVTLSAPPIEDSRYVKLEGTLSETFGPMDGYKVDLPYIISSVEALHAPPVHAKKKYKSKVALKMQAFMAARKIVF